MITKFLRIALATLLCTTTFNLTQIMASNLSSRFGEPEEVWGANCPKCSSIIPMDADHCKRCGYKVPKGAFIEKEKEEEKKESKEEKEFWSCPECKLKNDISRSTCSRCKVSKSLPLTFKNKEKEEEKVSDDKDAFDMLDTEQQRLITSEIKVSKEEKKEKESWTCPECKLKNDMSQSKCTRCKVSKSLAPQVEKKVSKEKPKFIIDDVCCICTDNPPTHVILPCKHQCLCEKCSTNMKVSGTCPICRSTIQEIKDTRPN